MFDVGAVIGKLKMDIRDFKSGMDSAKKEVKAGMKKMASEAKKGAQKMGASMKKGISGIASAAKTATIAIAAIGTAAALAGKQFADLASDAHETQAKFNVVFRGMENEANAWAESFADGVGRAKHEIKGFSAGMADVLKPMGMTTEEAFNMSTAMAELALDVASFNNKTDAEVINAFTSALTGERESLKSLGIVMSEADVKNEAYRLGLVAQGVELDKAAKTQATMSLLFANTSDAQGDLARNQDSYAEKTKQLDAAWKDFSVELGKVFLPIAIKILDFFKMVVDDVLPKVQESISGLRERFSGEFLMIKEIVGSVVEWFKVSILPTLRGIFETAVFLIEVFKEAWAENWYGIQELVSAVWMAMKSIVIGVIEIISSTISLVMAAIRGDWKTVWESIKNIASNIWDIIKNSAIAFFSVISSIFSLGGDLIGKAWGATMNGVANAANAIWETVKSSMKSGINWMIKKLNWLIDQFNSVAEMVPGVGGNTMGRIPMLADGGIVSSPTLAMIGEGGEPEAVIPLSKLGDIAGGSGNSFHFYEPVGSEDAIKDMMNAAFSEMKPNLSF